MQKKQKKSNSKVSFNEKCYEILKKIPKGKVVTYKQIAHKLHTKAYRAVGNAMNKNPYAYALGEGGRISSAKQKSLVPCHRVINSNGNIGGFGTGVKNKIKLLKKEGVEIINNKIDLKKYGYKL